ncbi:MAG: hypothetical protein ACHQ50_05665 [Fimbriimonadales bacterium]
MLKIVATRVPGAVPFNLAPASLPCWAIGGALVPSIQLGDSWLPPARDPINTQYPPNYIQYLGYTFNGTKPSVYLQAPQTGIVASGSQPEGTTFEWTITGNATFFPNPPTPTEGAVQISATDQSGTGSIQVKCTFHFSNNDPNDPVSGQADDDSDATPPPGSQTTAPDYYHFTAHRPELTWFVRLVDQDTATGPDSWGHQVVDQLYLQDHLGQPMPGCWMQERFPDLQLELQVNNPNGSILDFDTNGVDTWWTTGSGGAFGAEDQTSHAWSIAQDGLSLTLPSRTDSRLNWQYADHPSNPHWTLVQELWGGTRNSQVSPEAPGIHIDNYTLKYWTDQILRILSGF